MPAREINAGRGAALARPEAAGPGGSRPGRVPLPKSRPGAPP